MGCALQSDISYLEVSGHRAAYIQCACERAWTKREDHLQACARPVRRGRDLEFSQPLLHLAHIVIQIPEISLEKLDSYREEVRVWALPETSSSSRLTAW